MHGSPAFPPQDEAAAAARQTGLFKRIYPPFA